MAQVTETVARGILAGHGYTDNEVRQLAHHWLASHGQAPAQPAGPCVICGSDAPFTGTCGSGDPRALCKQPTSAQAADSVPAVSDLPPLPAPDLRDVGTKPQEIKEFLKGYATEYARTAIAARAPADSGFDYKTAADFLSGKTVSDEALRKFVAASRGAHDARAALHAKMLSLQGELASREAEIALLKRSLLDAEAAPQPSPTPQADNKKKDQL